MSDPTAPDPRDRPPGAADQQPLTRREALARETGADARSSGRHRTESEAGPDRSGPASSPVDSSPAASVPDSDEGERVPADPLQGLPGPNPEPENAGTREQAWRRLRNALTTRAWRSQLLAGAICALLGFAFVAQIQQTEESGLDQLSETELVRVLADVDDRNERLEAEASQLTRDEQELQSGSNQREAARQQASDRAAALSILAGTVAVTGPGIVAEIDGSAGVVTAANLVTFVQELRDAGAEAIDINGTRVVVDTYFTESEDGGLLVDGTELTLPLTTTVIGEPDTIATAMRIPGGAADTIEQRGGRFEVETRDAVDIDSVVAPAPEGSGGRSG